MVTTHQYHILLQNLSIQAKHAEIFPNPHSSLISIGQLCDNECIVTFEKHKVIVSKNSGLWRFPHHHPAQNNKQANIMDPQLCNHSRPMAPRHPRAYCPTSQKGLAIFTIRYSAAQPNTPCSRQSRMDPSQHGQDSQIS